MQCCPVSTLNPATGKPLDLKLIRKVCATDCYDLDPENPWRYQTKSKKVFLPDDVMEHRVVVCRWFLRLPSFSDTWFYNSNVVWIDPCSSIIPSSSKQNLRMN